MTGSGSCRRTLQVHALGFAAGAALAGAIAAASVHGSPVRADSVHGGSTWGVVFIALLASAFGLYGAALFVLRLRGGNLALVCVLALCDSARTTGRAAAALARHI